MKLVTRTSVFLWIVSLTLSEDTAVTCFYSENCVLPCQSQLHDIIHWYLKDVVHSFYDNKDQLDYQDQKYKGRTEMFVSEINKGNVSLLLKNIQIQDEGRYKCYTANDKTNEEKYVVVSVVAPVKSVDITLNKDTVTCITSGVYPEPLVSWSSDPPSTTTTSKTEENLFVVTSELKREDVNVDTYNCLIINPKDKKILYTANLKLQEISLQDEVTLQCPIIKDSPIILSFNSTILRYDSQTSQISDEWKDRVTFSPESGTVKLLHLNSKHLGTYTCESSTAQTRNLIRTVITQPVTVAKAHITLGLVIPLLIILSLIGVIIFVIRKKKVCKKESATSDSAQTEPTERQPFTTKNKTNGTPETSSTESHTAQPHSDE